jgi:uncharacterized protein YoxC
MTGFIQVDQGVPEQHDDLLNSLNKLRSINDDLAHLRQTLEPVIVGQTGEAVRQRLSEFEQAVDHNVHEHSAQVQRSQEGAQLIQQVDSQAGASF